MEEQYKKLMETRRALVNLAESPLLSMETLRQVYKLKQDLDREIEEYRKAFPDTGSKSAD